MSQRSFMSHTSRPPKLLIVDDNDINRILFERMFIAHGYETAVAEDGEDALNKLAEGGFDIVLLDIMMPIMDGLTALEHIRAHKDTASLPVILISAMSDTEDVVRGLALGANDYITKPVDMEIALARVRTQVTLKMLMDEREETIEQLRRSEKMREQLFRMASHDLKNPLNNLRIAQTLLKELIVKDPQGALELLGTMRVTISSMNHVVKDFLDSSALESGEIDMKIAQVSPEDLLRDVIAAQSSYAYEKRIAIEVPSLTHTAMWCDPARMTQVLGNLLSNAIKYSPPDSSVRLWADDHEQGVAIYVADSGPGIPEGERAKLFQPFGKLSTRPTAGESSHGLGLWSAKHLINLQGGEIDVECPPSGGSVFWVTVPAVRASV